MLPFIILFVLVIFLAAFFCSRIFAGGVARPLPNAGHRAMMRYAPMQRLLDNTDYRFLAMHPAFGKARARALRARRRRVFRGYLRCLSRDYARVCASIRNVMIESGIDRPDLAKALLRNRAVFTAALFAIEFRLILHACGWGTVDVRDMVSALEGMRRQLDTLVTGGIGLQPSFGAA